MNNNFEVFCAELEAEIKNAYEQSITQGEAEKLAAKFLHALLIVADRLQEADLDARMRKTGVKALKAAVYLQGATATEKKPSDVLLQAQVDTSEEVISASQDLDRAEADHDYLQNKYNIFKEAHVFFRGISKGSFNG